MRARLRRGARELARGVGERVEQRQQLGRALLDRRALARDRLLVAARDRAGERALGAERRPVLDRRAHERHQRGAVDARGRRQALGRALERDQEVRGDRGGRVVGGAIVVGDARGAHARAASASASAAASARGVDAVDGAARAARTRRAGAPAGTVISGCSANASWPASGARPGGARAVADERARARPRRPPRRSRASGTHSSTIVGARVRAAAERAVDGAVRRRAGRRPGRCPGGRRRRWRWSPVLARDTGFGDGMGSGLEVRPGSVTASAIQDTPLDPQRAGGADAPPELV